MDVNKIISEATKDLKGMDAFLTGKILGTMLSWKKRNPRNPIPALKECANDLQQLIANNKKDPNDVAHIGDVPF